MNSDSEALSEARVELEAAVRKFVDVKAQEHGTEPGAAIILGWAGFAEYTTIDMEREDVTGNVVLVPDGQAASMSRGLLAFAADAFSR